MTILLIARHGNTFEKNETPRRVGARTDIPLTETGRAQARALGQWMKNNGYYPETVHSSQLQRTIETAQIALKEAGYKEPVYPLAIFNEVDYGPDENQTEDEVVRRLGQKAVSDWDENGVVPKGWNFDPERCIENWRDFAAHILRESPECVLVVTSNGIARFAPHITGDFEVFRAKHRLKISTGAVCVLKFDQGRWTVLEWNVKPTC